VTPTRPKEILRDQATTKKVVDDLDDAQKRLDDAQTLYELGA
jgi:hypothetical protein